MKIVCSLALNKALATAKGTVKSRTTAAPAPRLASASQITICVTVLPLLANTRLICKQKRLCMTRSTDSKIKVLHKAFKIRSSNL